MPAGLSVFLQRLARTDEYRQRQLIECLIIPFEDAAVQTSFHTMHTCWRQLRETASEKKEAVYLPKSHHAFRLGVARRLGVLFSGGAAPGQRPQGSRGNRSALVMPSPPSPNGVSLFSWSVKQDAPPFRRGPGQKGAQCSLLSAYPFIADMRAVSPSAPAEKTKAILIWTLLAAPPARP